MQPFADRYLTLLQDALTGMLYRDPPIDPWSGGFYSDHRRWNGTDWPSLAPTMIGNLRLDNLRRLCTSAIETGVPGDFLEAGIWRGGACIMMRAVLDACEDTTRRVFAADSFCGLPRPTHEMDVGDIHHTYPQLGVSRAQVEENMRRYRHFDDRVVFLEGWFSATLPGPVERLAVLRLDGDMYGSTMDVLGALYNRVSPGGFVIVDDYCLPPCRAAITRFREDHQITADIQDIDGNGVWWQVPT